MINPMDWGGLNFCTVVRGCDRYVFLFDDRNLFALERTVSRFVMNPELNFTAADGMAVMKNAKRAIDMEDL